MDEVPNALPVVIREYQDAHDRHDVDTALACFATTATVIDEDEQWSGEARIRAWLAKTSSEYTFTRTLLSAQSDGEHSWVVRNRLDGNFPGNTVDLDYRFTLDVDGGRILSLSIAP